MTKRKATRTPPKTGSELMCSGKIGSSGSLCDARCLTLVTNPVPVVSHEWGKNRIVIATQVLPNGWPMYLSVKSGWSVLLGEETPFRTTEFSPVFSGVRVTWSLVLCVCFVDCYLSFVLFLFGHCVVWKVALNTITLAHCNWLVMDLSIFNWYQYHVETG
jgi:hypothetical protein